MLAWHFLKGNKTLRYEKTVVEKGVTLKCDPDKIELCKFGYHASKTPLEALGYLDWDNAILCKVELSGKIIDGDDKVVASERKIIEWCYVDDILYEFACRCAEKVLPIYEEKYPNDDRPRKAIEAKRVWLKDKSLENKEKLNKARDAAWGASDAAWCAARAASDAARDVARYAASDVAWCAARASARDVARYAASDVAWCARYAEIEWQNQELIKMFEESEKIS